MTPQERREARLALGFPTIEAWAKHIGRGRDRVGMWEAGTIEPPAMYDMLLLALLEVQDLRSEVERLRTALREIVAKHEAPEPPEPYDPSMTAEEIAIEEAAMAEYREGCTGAYATCARIARRALEQQVEA